jgi:AcrR family transcriptional regulator
MLRRRRQQPIAIGSFTSEHDRVSCPGTGGTVSTAKTDRRVRRTRELLRRALFSLIQEQGYNRITVQDLLDRADIGRSTFYAHYRDKDDLLQSAFEDIRSALAAERKAAEQTTGAPSGFLQPLLVVFRHVEGHRHLWQPLAHKGGAEVVTRIMRDHVTDLVREHLRSQFPGLGRNQPQLEAAVQFVAGACLGLLIWWLDNDVPYSAEKLYAIFRRLTTQGVRRFLIAS